MDEIVTMVRGRKLHVAFLLAVGEHLGEVAVLVGVAALVAGEEEVEGRRGSRIVPDG